MDSKDKKIGFVGVGEGGSRIAQSFSVKNYSACLINTAKSDSDSLALKKSAKLVLDSVIAGAGKDPKVGEEIFSANQELISEFLKFNVEGRINFLIYTIGGGGGSGTGWIKSGFEISQKLEIQTGAIYTLPLNSEDKTTKSNCIRGLKVLYELIKSEEISPVILIDNQKILENYPNLSITKFWQKANMEIVRTFDYFNILPRRKSIYYSALDSMDYARIFSSPGFMTFGKAELTEFKDKLALTDCVRSSVENGLMCRGYDLTKAKNIGIVLIGSEKVLNKIPAKSIDYAFESINGIMSNGTVFKGVYRDESFKDKLVIFAVFSGLGLPEQRIEELKAGASQKLDIEENGFDFGTLDDEDRGDDWFFRILKNKRTKKF